MTNYGVLRPGYRDMNARDMNGDELRAMRDWLGDWPPLPGGDEWVQPCSECDKPVVCGDPEDAVLCDDPECQAGHADFLAIRKGRV